MRSAAAVLVCALASAAACGGQTGEGTGFIDNQCVDRERRPLDESEEGALGYSPADVLAFASQQELLIELPGAESSPLTATLTLKSQSGTAEFIRTESPRPVASDPCRGRIEQGVEAALDVELPSGSVQLRAAGKLQSDSKCRARLSAKLSAAELDRIQPLELGPEEELRALDLRATLTPEGSAGAIEALVAYWVRIGPQPEPRGDAPRARDYMNERQVLVANWPAASSCDLGELPLPAERALFQVSPAEALSAFTESRALRWSDGTSTRVTFEAHATGDACLADMNPSWSLSWDYPPIPPEDPALFGLPIDLTVATEDGRLRAQFAAILQYEPNKTGGLARAWLIHDVSLAPGDDGGWTVDVADTSEGRITVLDLQLNGSRPGTITLARRGRAEPCSTGSMCAGTPPIAEPVLRGTLE